MVSLCFRIAQTAQAVTSDHSSVFCLNDWAKNLMFKLAHDKNALRLREQILKTHNIATHAMLYYLTHRHQSDSQGYDPKRSRVNDDTMMDFIRGTIAGTITEVPGIGPAAAKKMAAGDGDDAITNTYQLIGKVSLCIFTLIHCGKFKLHLTTRMLHVQFQPTVLNAKR